MQFSAQHIRNQPEYQLLMMSKHKPTRRIGINLDDLSLRLVDIVDDVDKRPDRSMTMRHISSKLQEKNTRPSSSPSKTTTMFPKTGGTTACKSLKIKNRPSTGGSSVHSILSLPSQKSIQNYSYDPNLEKSSKFLKGCGGSFSQASQALMPLKRGLKRVEVHYSETNVAQNDSLIFADLIRNSHKSNIICKDNVDSLERRLETRRSDDKRATTFYDTGIKPPTSFTGLTKRTRTVAGKKGERKKRIKKRTGEIGNTPRLRPSTCPDFETVLNCRYLRVDPKFQRELYEVETSPRLFE